MLFQSNRKLRRSSRLLTAATATRPAVSAGVAMFDQLEKRVLFSYTPTYAPGMGTLTGDGTPNEKLTIIAVGGLLEYNDGSGFTPFWDSSHDTLPASPTTTVQITELGINQHIVLGAPAYPASNLNATFQLNGSSEAGDSVLIDDSGGTEQADSVVMPYVIDTGSYPNYSITGPGINFQEPNGSSPGGIVLKGSSADDTYDVLSTYYDNSNLAEEPVTIIAGKGNNTVNVGDDPSNTSATVSNISGTLNVTDPTGSTALVINDQGDMNANSVIITNNSVTGLSSAPINYTSGATPTTGVTSLTLLGGPGAGGAGMNYNVQSTSANTPVDVVTSGANDTVLISNNHSVAGILGSVNVDNASTGYVGLTVDASGDTNSTTSTLSGGPEATLHGLAPADITYSAPTLSSLTIDNTTGSNLFTVDFSTGNPIPPYSTSSGLTYNGGGGASSAMMLTGGTFNSEVHNANGPGYGNIALTAAGVETYISYTGLTPIGDSTNTTTYTFNDNATPDPSYIIQNGTGTGQSLIAGSLEFAPDGSGFETTDITNKTNVKFVVTTNSINNGTVDVTTAPAGLTTFNIKTQSGGDDLNVIALPQGVTSSFNLGGGGATAEVLGSGLPTGTTIGDGGPGNNTLTYDAGGQPVTETFGPAPRETIITQGTKVLDARRFTTVDIINAPAPAVTFTTPPAAITGTEGVTLSNIVLTSFTVPAGAYNASNFIASVNWGDGTTSGTTVTQDAVNPSLFYVHGTHTYTEEGTYSPTVFVTFSGGNSSTIQNGVHFNVFTTGSSNTSQVESATIADAPLLGAASPIIANVGNDTGVVQVGYFSDTGGAEPVGNYTATVNYGDGTATQTATIVQSGTNFIVDGDHTYLTSGKFITTVTITDDGGTQTPGTQLIVTSVANVAAATLTLSPAGTTINAVEGKSFNGPVATITDTNPLDNGSTIQALINWGDGTSTNGVVTQTSPGNFAITGPHTYAEEGTYKVSVTINYPNSANALNSANCCTQTVLETAVVSDPSVNATAGHEINSTEGYTNGVNTLATFTDPGGPEVLTDYSANVTWGDGSSGIGVISYNSTTHVFSVQGSHIYQTGGEYVIHVTIYHETSTPVTVTLGDSSSGAPILGTGITTLAGKQNTAFTNLVLATFQDTNPYATNPAHYSATINYGDGSAPVAGTIVYNSSTKRFSILGSHKYLTKGVKTITITLHDDLSSTVITSKITVS